MGTRLGDTNWYIKEDEAAPRFTKVYERSTGIGEGYL
jgi:hypothetical protein